MNVFASHSLKSGREARVRPSRVSNPERLHDLWYGGEAQDSPVSSTLPIAAPPSADSPDYNLNLLGLRSHRRARPPAPAGRAIDANQAPGT